MTTKTKFSTTAKAALLGLLLSSAATGAFAQDDRDAKIAALEVQVQQLAAQIADLKTQTTDLKTKTTELTAEAQAPQRPHVMATEDHPATPSAPNVSLTGGRPSIASSDGSFSINLHGILQLDAANYSQKANLPATTIGPDLNSGTNFRRARIGFDGRLFSNFDYYLLFDFGGAGTEPGAVGNPGSDLYEGWIQYSGYRLADKYPVRLRIGAFAPSQGLEDAASTNGSPFVERASPSQVDRSLAGGDQRIGGQLQSNGDHWLAAIAVTGAKVGDAQTFDEQLGFTGRVAATPFYGDDWRIHIGANASYVDRPAQSVALSPVTSVTLSDRPELRVDGMNLITTGGIDADHADTYGAEFAAQKGPFLLQGEYFRYDMTRRVPIAGASNPSFHGWYAEAGWLLTGEHRLYNTSTAAFDGPGGIRPFDPAHGRWGAWELVARYSDTDLNSDAGLAGTATPAGGVRGGDQKIWTAGVNWFVNPAVKFAFQYQWVDIDRLTAAGAPAGQAYRTLAFRSQFAF